MRTPGSGNNLRRVDLGETGPKKILAEERTHSRLRGGGNGKGRKEDGGGGGGGGGG